MEHQEGLESRGEGMWLAHMGRLGQKGNVRPHLKSPECRAQELGLASVMWEALEGVRGRRMILIRARSRVET